MSRAIRARGNPEVNPWQLAGAAGVAVRDDATGNSAGDLLGRCKASHTGIVSPAQQLT